MTKNNVIPTWKKYGASSIYVKSERMIFKIFESQPKIIQCCKNTFKMYFSIWTWYFEKTEKYLNTHFIFIIKNIDIIWQLIVWKLNQFYCLKWSKYNNNVLINLNKYFNIIYEEIFYEYYKLFDCF